MSQPFMGTIALAGFSFAPAGWALCNGQLMSISQNSALFSLLGTTYGGDGVNTFGLPDLRGRALIHQGTGPGLSNYVMGQMSGTESVTLTTGNIPAHTHTWPASTAAATGRLPVGNVLGAASVNAYQSAAPAAALAPATIGTATGSSVPHENMMPYQTVNYIIALQGIFPSRN